MFDTQEEAIQKLAETIISHNGLPIFVQSAKGRPGGKINVYYYYLDDPNKESRSGDITDPKFDFRNLGDHIGYMNVSESQWKDAIYLRRMAVRRSHNTQGISRHNLNIPKCRGATSLGIPDQRFTFQNVMRMKTFVNMFKGEYPTIKQIKLAFAKENIRVGAAFSRRLAINKSPIGIFNLEWKGQDIGFSEDLDTFKLGPDFRYLGESIEEAGLRVA